MLRWCGPLLLFLMAGWIAMTTVLWGPSPSAYTRAVKEGFLAPDFDLKTSHGSTMTLDSLKGKIIVINFFTSWCPPCKKEMPTLQKVYENNKDQGVVVIGINATDQDTKTAAEQFTKDQNISFPILYDKGGLATKLYKIAALPTTIIVDQQGIIRKIIYGGPIKEAFLNIEINQASTTR